ncbi:MAG: glucodextranase DOMON-like domain-containing protein [Elusimicrobiota bacterium]
MKQISKKLFFALIGTMVFYGCAKRPAPLDPSWEDVEEAPRISESVLIARVDISPVKDDFELTEKILGEFRDSLEKIKQEQKPIVIAVTPYFIRRISNLYEQEDYLNEEILTAPRDLSSEKEEYLSSKYEVETDTQSILNAQVKEAVSLLGDSLKSSATAQYLVEKSTYSISDKEKIVDFINFEIDYFEPLLKEILQQEYVTEAVTSLTDAYVGLLDAERIRVQIIEGIVAYKRWRGNFPSGFIPRSGFINREAAQNIQRTGITWIMSEPYGEIRHDTHPRVIDNVLMTDISFAVDLLESPGFKPIDIKEYLADTAVDSEDLIELAGTEFVQREWERTDEITNKIFNILQEIRDEISRYRDSGRARIHVLSDVRRNFLTAESGEIIDNINKPVYDKVFRKSIIDIYRDLGISAPAGLFLPLYPYEPMKAKRKTKIPGMNDLEEKAFSRKEPAVFYSIELKEEIKGVKEIQWRTEDDRIYFTFLNSTSPAVESVSVYMGHENVPSASLTPRGMDYKIENVAEFPLHIEGFWERNNPGRTSVYRASGRERWELLSESYDVEHSTGRLTFALDQRYLGSPPEGRIFLKFRINDKFYPREDYYRMTLDGVEAEKALIHYIDPSGDAYGPGNYSFPEEFEDLRDNFDLRHIKAQKGEGENIVTLGFSDVSLLKEPTTNFFNPVIDLYIDINKRKGAGRTDMLKGRNTFTEAEDAWEYVVTLGPQEKVIYNTSGRKVGEPQININSQSRTVNIFIPESMIGASLENWGIIPVVLAGGEDGEIAPVRERDEEGKHITGRRDVSDTNIIDVILPSGHGQREVLGANRKGGAIVVPALRD